MKRVVYPDRPAQPSLADAKKDIEFGLSEPNKIKFTDHDGKILAEIPVEKVISKEHNDSLDALTYVLKAQEGINNKTDKLNARKADLLTIKEDIFSLGSDEDKWDYYSMDIKLRDMEEAIAIDSPQFHTYLEDFDERMKCLRYRVKELRKAEDLKCQQNDDTKPDMVNHPPHYNVNGFEVIDIIKAFTEGLNGIAAVDTGNAIKYILRWQHKNGVEDLKKAKWYIEHLITELEKESK